MIFFAIFTMITFIPFRETFHSKLKQHRLKELGLPIPPTPPVGARIKAFATIALFRPIRMLFTEPIVGLTSLYVACMFATLFSFFAAFPYIFRTVYHFNLEQSGLVFLSIVIGCVLGTVTIILCNALMYMPQTKKFPPHETPPEYRLYPAIIGSFGLPLGLFWFAWTARSDISWVSPAAAMIPFSWGNLCLFVSTIQYLVDTYRGSVIASAAGANGLARYGLAGAFPLFTLQSKPPILSRCAKDMS
jgi:Major Facilitator Superfamily